MGKLTIYVLFLSFCSLSALAQNNKINAEKFNKQAEAAYQRVQSNTDRDSLAIYRAVIDGILSSLKCDEYDRMPNRKGKVKPEFSEENLQRVTTLYPMLIDAGLFLLKNNYTKMEGQKA